MPCTENIDNEDDQCVMTVTEVDQNNVLMSNMTPLSVVQICTRESSGTMPALAK